MSTKQTQAAYAFDSTKGSLTAAKEALALYTAQMREAKNRSAEVVAEKIRLKAAVQAEADAHQAAKQALKDANAELNKAVAAEKAQESAVNGSERAIKSLNAQLDKQSASYKAAKEAAQQAGVNTRELADAQDRLSRTLAVTQSAANSYKSTLESTRQAATNVANASRQAGDLMHNAFAVVGVRSAAAIEAEMEQVRQALLRIASQSNITGAELKRAMSAGNVKMGALQAELDGVNGSVGKTTSLAGMAGGALKQLALVYSGVELAQKFVQANMELENNVRALKAVTGSSASAARELSFIRQQANYLGVSVNDLTKTYIGFLAASKGTSLEGERSQQVFLAVSNALGKIGASSYQTERAFTALTQMVSKGVVSMEEMRQQLSESLPGAFNAAANGMRVTTGELMKMIESGTLLTTDFLPAMSRGLDETFGKGAEKIQGLQQSWERFKQSLVDLSTGASGSAASGFMSKLLDSATELTNRLATLSDGQTRFWTASGKAIEKYANENAGPAVKRMGAAWDYLSERVSAYSKATDTAISNAIRAIEKYAGVQQTQTAEEKKAADQAAQSSENYSRLVKEYRDMTDALSGNSSVAEVNARMQKGISDEMAKLSAEVAKGDANFSKINFRYSEISNLTHQAKQAIEKLVEAKRIEGEVSMRVANLSGDEARILAVATNAARENAAGRKELAIAAQRDLAATQQQIETLQKEIAAEKIKDENKLRALEVLQRTLPVKIAEVEKTKQMAQELAIEADARRVVSQTYLDNSMRVNEYRAALDRELAALREVQVAHLQGKATADQVKAAQLDVAKATALYNDSINDLIANKKREGDIMVASAQLIGQEVIVRKAQAQATADNIKVTDQHIEAMRRSLAAKREEAMAIEAERVATGQLTAEKATMLAGLRDEIATKEQAIKTAEQSALSLRLEAEAARTDSEAIKDHSKYTAEYGMAAWRAQQQVAALVIAEKEGRASSDEVAQARIRAAGATKLYVDALKDAVQAEEFKLNALARDAQLTDALLNKEMAHAQALERVARLHGDEAGAIRAKLMQKEIEIKMVEATIAAKRAEAAQIEELVAAMQKEAEMDGIITAAEKEQIDARAANAAAIRAEADASAELVAALREEIQVQREAAEASRATSSGSTSSSSSSSNSSSNNWNSSNNSNNSNGGMAPGGTVDLISMMYAMGVSVADAQAARQYIDDTYKQAVATSRPGESYAAINESAIQNALMLVKRDKRKSESTSGVWVDENNLITLSNGNKIIDPSLLPGNLLRQNPLSGPNTQIGSGSQPQQDGGRMTTPEQPMSTQPVTININGTATRLNMGSMGDVNALETVLRNLTQAANRT